MRKRKIQIVISILVLIFLSLLIYFSNIDNSRFTVLENLTFGISKNLSNVRVREENKTKAQMQGKSLDEIEKENIKLKEQIEKVEELTRELEVVKADNNNLTQLLNLKNQYPSFETVPGMVITQNISNAEKTAVINVGKVHGIEKDMIVITSKGLYGRVVTVNDNNSKVLLAIDEVSKVSAKVGNVEIPVIAKGNLENKIILTRLPMDFKLTVDEKVYTSGNGGIYPSGIFIGNIKELRYKTNQTDSYAVIEPAVDYENVTKVLVIKRGV